MYNKRAVKNENEMKNAQIDSWKRQLLFSLDPGKIWCDNVSNTICVFHIICILEDMYY